MKRHTLTLTGSKQSWRGMLIVSSRRILGKLLVRTWSVEPRSWPLSTFISPLCQDSWHWLDGSMRGRSWQLVCMPSYVPMEKVNQG